MNQHQVKANHHDASDTIADPIAKTEGADWLSLLHRSIGNAAVGRLFGQPSVAPAVQPGSVLQRLTAAEAHANGRAQKDEPIVQQVRQSKSGGETLSPETRAGMEQHLGLDLSQVRVHTDPSADALSRQLNAHAFTSGTDIFFRRGAFAPESSAGLQTLAHELTHVAQQSGLGTAPSRVISQPGDPAEREAETTARQLTAHPFRAAPADSQPGAADGASNMWAAPPVAAVQKAPEEEELLPSSGGSGSGQGSGASQPPGDDTSGGSGSDKPAGAAAGAQPPAEPPPTASPEDEEDDVAVQRIAIDEEEMPPSSNGSGQASETSEPSGDGTSAGSGIENADDSLTAPPPKAPEEEDDDAIQRLAADEEEMPPSSGGPSQASDLSQSSDNGAAPESGTENAPDNELTAPPPKAPEEDEDDAAIQRLVASDIVIQRDNGAGAPAAPAKVPDAGAPSAGAPATPAGDFPKEVQHEGKTLTDDPSTLDKVCEAVATEKGLKGLNQFASTWATRAGGHDDPNSPEAGYWMGILSKLDEAVARLVEKAQGVEKDFERIGLNVIQGMLNESEKKLHAEQERYGLKDVSDAPTGGEAPAHSGPTYESADNKETEGMIKAAGEMAPLRTELDNLYAEREKLEVKVVSNNAGPMPSFQITDQPRHDKLTEDITAKEPEFEKFKKERVSKYPILAAFTDRGGGSNLASIGAEKSGGQDIVVGPLIAKELANIDKVRAAIADNDLTVWDVETVVRGAQADAGWAPGSLNHRLTSDMFKEKQRDKAIAKLAFAAFQIALTIAGAAISGGASIGFQIARARAGVAGASAVMSTVSAVQSLKEYELAKAMNGTDPEKAKVIAADDPSLFWLALDVVGAVADVFQARTAFVTLKGYVSSAIISGEAVQAGDDAAKAANAASDLTKLEEAAKPYPGVYQKAVKKIEEAQGDPSKVMAAIDEAGHAKGDAARQAMQPPTSGGSGPSPSTPAGAAFQKKILAASEFLDDMVGRIPDLVREWIAQGKVRPLTRNQLIVDFGHMPGWNGDMSTSLAHDLIANGYLNKPGFYDPNTGRVYLAAAEGATAGSDFAGTLIHEAEHHLKYIAMRNRLLQEGMDLRDASKAAGQALMNFESEIQAHIAERDFYILTFLGENSPRYGKAHIFASERAKRMMVMSDGELMSFVERNYTDTMSPHLKAAYTPSESVMNVEEYVQGILDDLTTHYETMTPGGPAGAAGAAPTTP